MIAIEPLQDVRAAALRIGLGFSSAADSRRAVLDASESARDELRGASAQIALVVTAGLAPEDPVPAVRAVLGRVGVAGGATTRVMTDAGISERGSLVIAVATSGDAATGVASAAGTEVREAGQATARIVMAGWPFRLRYPRGLGMAFIGHGAPRTFLEAWRQFMGPKMRTVCGAMPGGVYGGSSTRPLASVACLEASYATGLGYAEGLCPDDSRDPSALIAAAEEAATAAVQRLHERPARLVIVLDTLVRHDALGAASEAQWRRLRAVAGAGVPCVGWTCERVDGYGRGIQPGDQPGALVVAAIGDGPGCNGGS